MGLLVTDKHYEHMPERVICINSTIIVWDVSVIIDRTVLAHWPDIVLHDKKEKTWLLISVAISDDSNINTKETETLNKYKDLEIEFIRMWKVRTKMTGALRTIKRLDQNLQLFPAHPSAIELQKIGLLSTAHIILKCWGKWLWSFVEIWTNQKTAT